jgi:electron transport complex protein RnfG
VDEMGSLRIAWVLAIICLISGASLAVTYLLIRERIAEVERRAIEEALAKVFPFANMVERNVYYEAELNGEIIGYAAITEGVGFGGRIKMVVGIKTDGTVERVHIISHMETPGLGSRITEEEFLNQFRGKRLDELRLRVDGGEIDAITGATISSRAVADAAHQKVQGLVEMLKIQPHWAIVENWAGVIAANGAVG